MLGEEPAQGGRCDLSPGPGRTVFKEGEEEKETQREEPRKMVSWKPNKQ